MSLLSFGVGLTVGSWITSYLPTLTNGEFLAFVVIWVGIFIASHKRGS